MTLTLGYWDIRGFAQPIRNLLRYNNVKFEDVRYGFGEGPNYNTEEWLKVKFTLGLNFPNLPYLIDGDVKLTQSQAILRYLGRKFGICADNEKSKAKEDMIEYQIVDIRLRLIQTAYMKEYKSKEELDAEIENLKKDLDNYLTALEQFLGEQKWISGDKLSFVDFFVYEVIDWFRELADKNCLNKFPKMNAYMKRFEELEPLKTYLASDCYRKANIFSPFAKIGYNF